MQVTSLKDFTSAGSTGVCVGNFDGMHIGHQSLFKIIKAHELKNKVFLTFAPHPKKVFSKAKTVFEEITPLREKAKLAKNYGFNFFLPIKFSSSLIELTPRDFVKKIIVDTLAAKLVVVGYDWHFGKNRAGNLATLKEFGDQFGFEVIGVEKFEDRGIRVSSSQVRAALNDGNLELVNRLLGRDFALGARVIRGDQRGRVLGFPTANMIPKGQLLPARGVYITNTKIDNVVLPSISNIGIRPTFTGNTQLLETHLLGQSNLDLYGKCLEVTFLKRLRDEKKFPSKQDLIDQINEDCVFAQRYFSAEK